MLTLDEIIAACGHITATNSIGGKVSGTGYLIAPNLVATCEHVVKDAALETIEIVFDGTAKMAKSVKTNSDSDCAIIELADPLINVAPLSMGGACTWEATWHSYGFPAAAKGAGVTMRGIVSNPKAKDDNHVEVLELTSPEVAAGMASPLHGFSGSPVIVDGVVVGHLKRFLSDQNEPTRPAFGKVYATRATCVNKLRDDATLSEPAPIKPPVVGSPAYQDHLLHVRYLLDQWSKADMPPGQAGLVAAESLIQLGVPVEAIGVLNKVQLSVRKDQLMALALAKTQLPENIDNAVAIVEKLYNSGNIDPETGGILGGRLKQIWKNSGKETDLQKSHNIYAKTFENSGDPYPGINAAATALWLGQKQISEEIALDVLKALDAKSPGSMDNWDLATKAEALMLTGKIDQAKDWYKKAAQKCGYAPETIKTMQEQASHNLDVLGVEKEIVIDVFRPN